MKTPEQFLREKFKVQFCIHLPSVGGFSLSKTVEDYVKEITPSDSYIDSHVSIVKDQAVGVSEDWIKGYEAGMRKMKNLMTGR